MVQRSRVSTVCGKQMIQKISLPTPLGSSRVPWRTTPKRCNMVLAEVAEMWVRVPETKGKTIAPLYKDRFVPMMLLGGRFDHFNFKGQRTDSPSR